jgi:nicotinamide mononucleotide adenylyltransferase
MCQLAVADSDLIMVDPWEAAQSGYQRTISVLKRVEERVNAARPAGEGKHRLDSGGCFLLG